MKRLFATIAITLAFAVMSATSSFAQILTPQGRLTLTSNTPVMTSDVVGATTVYYTPYVGNSLPVSNGTSLSNQTFSQLSVSFSLASPDQVEDVYAIYVSSAFQLCLVDSWGSHAGRTSALDVTQLQGIWVNASSISGTGASPCETATNNYSVPAKTGIYLGSIYTSAHPGTTTVGTTVQFTPAAAAGGSDTIIGLWNAYNRVRVTTSSADSTPSWTNSSSTWRNADNSASNSITWVDGLAQTSVSAAYDATAVNGLSTGEVQIGLGINALTTPLIIAQITSSTALLSMHAATISGPVLGLSTVQAIERAPVGTATYYGPFGLLTLETEY